LIRQVSGIQVASEDQTIEIKLVEPNLVSIMFWLVRSFNGNANVVCLSLRHLGEFDADLFKMKSSHLFVQLLGQHVDSDRVFFRVGP